MRLLFSICMMSILFLTMSCATTEIRLPEKYSLDSQLKSVDQVKSVQLGERPAFPDFDESFADPIDVLTKRDTMTFSELRNQWIRVDLQSFLLRSGPNDYYLLILHAPAAGIMSTDTLSFTVLTNSIKAGADFLDLNGAKYMVEKIYKIENTQQMYAIKNQLTKQENIEQ